MSAITVFAETSNNRLDSTAAEMITAGRLISNQLGNELNVVVIGENISRLAEEISLLGVNAVHVVDHPMLSNNNPDLVVAALNQVCAQIKPRVFLLAKTHLGKTVGPRLAYRMGVSIAQDCVSLGTDKPNDNLVVTRPVFGGNAMAKFTFEAIYPQIATLRIKNFEASSPNKGIPCRIEKIIVTLDNSTLKTHVLSTVKQESEGIRLEEAPVVVAGGRGLGGAKGFEQLIDLARLFNGAVGASRAVCDAGWLDHSFQIGLTGKTVSPNLYITVGISGASQHMAGCSGSKNIVAINKDPGANIFKSATYGVVGDWEKILPSFSATIGDLLQQ